VASGTDILVCVSGFITDILVCVTILLNKFGDGAEVGVVEAFVGADGEAVG